MREKARELHNRQLCVKMNEINSVRKMHQNLIKLNNYQRRLLADKSLAVVSTPAARPLRSNLRIKKNLTMVR